MFIALLAVWRELGPHFFNDLLLVTALTIIAQIDLKTMYIEGRTITFAVIMRLMWIIFFEPREMLFYLEVHFDSQKDRKRVITLILPLFVD